MTTSSKCTALSTDIGYAMVTTTIRLQFEDRSTADRLLIRGH